VPRGPRRCAAASALSRKTGTFSGERVLETVGRPSSRSMGLGRRRGTSEQPVLVPRSQRVWLPVRTIPASAARALDCVSHALMQVGSGLAGQRRPECGDHSWIDGAAIGIAACQVRPDLREDADLLLLVDVQEPLAHPAEHVVDIDLAIPLSASLVCPLGFRRSAELRGLNANSFPSQVARSCADL
jgi:hypothetical protein